MKRLVVTGLTVLPALFAVSAMGADTINAAGATFPAPIYQQWFSEYKMAHSDVQINYQPVGSGAGVRQLIAGTVDFAASDIPVTEEQAKDLKIKPLHFPSVMGAVVLTYNIPGVTATLKLTPAAIAGMFLGTVKTWDDAAIRSANPGLKLPSKSIEIVHRSDASGTSFVFTDYLAKVSPEWKTKVGAAAAVSWPTGLSGPQNAGVAGLVKQTPYAIGYVELTYAVQNKMPFADVQNAAGKFVTASFKGVSEAAANSKEMPADFKVSITNAPGAASYPISTFTWLLIPSEIKDGTKKAAITGFLNWMLTTGQKDAEGLQYAQLPRSVVAKEQKQIALIK
jgi:phosphate transport system substrate-binding protein